MASKPILKELKDLQKEPPTFCSAGYRKIAERTMSSGKLMEGEIEGESEHQNPLAVAHLKLIEAEMGFRRWLKKQPLPVMAAVATASGAAKGAAVGVALSLIAQKPPDVATWARNHAALHGVLEGTYHVMQRLRAKQDVHSSMVPMSCAGISYSLVSGVGLCGPNQPAANALSMGLVCGLFGVGLHQLWEKCSKPPEEHLYNVVDRDPELKDT